ncbi:MAG: DUF362 domain-containing protein [Candidatus Omnitrophota bacterium]
MKSEVYFVKLDTRNKEGRVNALKKLLAQAGRFLIYRKDEFIPIKLTIGDSPCVYNISPELVKPVISYVKRLGAKPFLFDTSVIYKGQRQNAVDHLTLAQDKGFGYSEVGAPFIIADGIFGSDGRDFLLSGPGIRKIKIPSFVGMLESLLVLSHPTGHIVSAYAGAIKNIAMGMACRATKQAQHSSLKPSVIEKKCVSCGCCIAVCPVNAIVLEREKANINHTLCLGCGECLCACKFDAIFINWQEEPEVFCRRMVEVAHFILAKFKNKFFLNFAFDITKECDCISAQGEKTVAEDIGILASGDILSLDKATTDLVYKHKKAEFSGLARHVYEGMFEYAAAKGLGNLQYQLVTL